MGEGYSSPWNGQVLLYMSKPHRRRSLVSLTTRNVIFLVWRSVLKTNDKHLHSYTDKKLSSLICQELWHGQFCMICSLCGFFFSTFHFLCTWPWGPAKGGCLHISKWRLTFRFLRRPLHCGHSGPSRLSSVCFPFGLESDCHPGCHMAAPYWSLSSKSSPQRGVSSYWAHPATAACYVYCLPRSIACTSGSYRVP